MKFLIDSKVYAKVMHLVNLCDKEISGLGKVKIEGNTIRIKDMYLLDQEVTGASTDISADAVGACLFQAYANGLEDGELLWWWHSHVNMAVFWSGTDMDTIKEFGKQGRFFATVFNKKAEMKSAYFQAGTTIYPECFVDDIPTLIDFGLTTEEIAQLDADFKAKVKERKWGKYQPKTVLGDNKLKSKVSNRFIDDPYAYSNDDWPSVFDDPSFWDDDYLNHNTHGYNGVGLRAGATKTKLRKGGKNERNNK